MAPNHPGARGSPAGRTDASDGAPWSPPPPPRFHAEQSLPENFTSASLPALGAAAAALDGVKRAAPAATPQLLVTLPATQADYTPLHTGHPLGAVAAATTVSSSTTVPVALIMPAGRATLAGVGGTRPPVPVLGMSS